MRTIGRLAVGAMILAGLAGVPAVKVQGAKAEDGKLKIYFVDVEGGQSTLFVTPGGHSLLIDTGWPGNDLRDANRIVAAAKKAGLSRIDTVLLTHYHVDHAGGIAQLVAKIPVGTFIDHGPNREYGHGLTDKEHAEYQYAEYQKVLASGRYKHIVAKPGEELPVRGMNVKVISADGNLIAKPLEGAGQKNEFCAVSEKRAKDETENAYSLGVEIMFGKLRILDLGDLTYDREMELMCPVNKLGTVDVLVVSHHGWFHSSSPALVHAIHPRVAIMNNGEKKGGSTPVLQTVRSSPGLETLWQLHFSDEGGTKNNTALKYISNPQGADGGYGLLLTGDRSGSFSVTNDRTGYMQNYPVR